MRNTKEYLSFLLGLLFILSLTGCSSRAKDTSPTDDIKVIADARVVANKKIEDAKIIADAKIEADKKIADAKILADNKISDAKAKEETAVAATVKEQPEQFIYKNYINVRYQYSIMYPNILKIIDSPTNGDGNNLQSTDGEVTLTIYGCNNVLDETVDSKYSLAIKDDEISYKKQSGNWFVTSYIEDDKIIYQKTVVGKGSINTFSFKYPISQKDKYSEVVEQLNKSFKTPSIDEAH